MYKKKRAMQTVFVWRLGTNFGVEPTVERKYICGCLLRKCVRLGFLPINDYDHTAVAAPVLRLRLTWFNKE